MDNLNEAMARRAADLETVNNRLGTLKEHYDALYAKLDAVMKVNPDYFEKGFTIVPFASVAENGSIRDELERHARFLGEMSKLYVRHMEQYEHIKDTHPEAFK